MSQRLLLPILLALLAACSSGHKLADAPAGEASWSTRYGDAFHRGGGLGGPASEPQERWRARIRGGRRLAPVAAGQDVYMVDGDSVVALQVADGSERWRARFPALISAAPAVAGDVLAVGREPNLVVGLRRADGQQVWQARLDRRAVESLLGLDGRVVALGQVFGGTDAATRFKLFSLDATTGKIEWEMKFPFGIQEAPTGGPGIVLQMMGQGIVVFDSRTGEPLWDFTHGEVGPTTAAIAQGSAYYASWKAPQNVTIHAIDLAARDQSWSREYQAPTSTPPPAWTPEALYVGIPELGLAALDPLTGAELWLSADSGAYGAQPAAGSSAVYTLVGERLRAVSRSDGHHLWEKQLPGRGEALAILGDTLVVQTSSWELIAYR